MNLLTFLLRSVLATVLLFCGIITTVDAHDTAITKCFKVKPKKMKEYIVENGMVVETYDLNGDGKVDVATYSPPLPDGKHTVPTFYEIDTDKDGDPDLLYIDVSGTMDCKKILLYMDYNDPANMNHEAPNTQRKALN